MLDNHPMTRFLVIVVLVVAAIWLLRRALRAPGVPGTNPPQAGEAGELVRCARCGVHLPRAEARMQGERLYCSEEHARLGPERG
jgi:uncharacterized protein